MQPAGVRDASFRQMFDEHFDAVARYCLRRLPREDAEDATARTFVVAWRKVEEMPAADAALPWLYRIASYEVSTIRRSIRRFRSLRSRLGGLAPSSSPNPDTIVVRRAEHEALVAALASLRPADREVILLRSYEDLPTTEIAAVLGCSPEAARKRLSRALRRLRRTAGLPEPAPLSRNSRAIEEGGDG